MLVMKAKEVKIAFDILEKFTILPYPVFVYSSVYVQYIQIVCSVMFCMRKNVNFTQFLPACISGTAQWKNLVPVSYCRTTQELSNGA